MLRYYSSATSIQRGVRTLLLSSSNINNSKIAAYNSIFDFNASTFDQQRHYSKKTKYAQSIAQKRVQLARTLFRKGGNKVPQPQQPHQEDQQAEKDEATLDGTDDAHESKEMSHDELVAQLDALKKKQEQLEAMLKTTKPQKDCKVAVTPAEPAAKISAEEKPKTQIATPATPQHTKKPKTPKIPIPMPTPAAAPQREESNTSNAEQAQAQQHTLTQPQHAAETSKEKEPKPQKNSEKSQNLAKKKRKAAMPSLTDPSMDSLLDQLFDAHADEIDKFDDADVDLDISPDKLNNILDISEDEAPATSDAERKEKLSPEDEKLFQEWIDRYRKWYPDIENPLTQEQQDQIRGKHYYKHKKKLSKGLASLRGETIPDLPDDPASLPPPQFLDDEEDIQPPVPKVIFEVPEHIRAEYEAIGKALKNKPIIERVDDRTLRYLFPTEKRGVFKSVLLRKKEGVPDEAFTEAPKDTSDKKTIRRRHQCPHCSFKFFFPGTLEAHIKSAHPDKQPITTGTQSSQNAQQTPVAVPVSIPDVQQSAPVSPASEIVPIRSEEDCLEDADHESSAEHEEERDQKGPSPYLTAEEKDMLKNEYEELPKASTASGNNAVAAAGASAASTKPVLIGKKPIRIEYEDELGKYADMASPWERYMYAKEKFGRMQFGNVEVPETLVNRVNNLLKGIPKNTLRKTAKLLSDAFRLRTSGLDQSVINPDNKGQITEEYSQRKPFQTAKQREQELLKKQHEILDNLEHYRKRRQKMEDKLKYSADENGPQQPPVVYGSNEALAYIAHRLPPIYAAMTHVFQEIAKRMPDFKPTTLLDFGTGPGTSIWAANEAWDHNFKETLAVEPSSGMMDIALQLLEGFRGITWRRFLNEGSDRRYDVVVASYVLSEITNEQERNRIIRSLWRQTAGVLVFVEPGTPLGFKLVREARAFLLNESSSTNEDRATVLAPCPHDGVCPMTNTKSWCHFSQRLERETFQRITKSGLTMPYEDEKFSYVVIRRRGVTGVDPVEVTERAHAERIKKEYEETGVINVERERIAKEIREYQREFVHAAHSWPRLVSRPIKAGGHVILDLCTPQATLERKTISHAMGREGGYAFARKAFWSDLFPFYRSKTTHASIPNDNEDDA